ncbi:hypothetical protein BV25DRAFT_1844785 [Artomyces pyxidatus]|uniref:Uncharacterized protein n=1 Tax=Artomyces pyxidatus TaxID=48021 RepID=A0ACB8TKE0_9AGAM|nr:hypothetical protein BV25DRAFT_1844785 [Artomyces pyxidatus]
MIDGIAICQRARWWKRSNEIIGLCREHAIRANLGMTDFPSVLQVADSIHGDAPSCHYGREATVAAIAPFAIDHYHPIPILLSATCKSETAPEFAVILGLLIEGWSLHGASVHGAMWFISTDGDATFRGALYAVLMDREFTGSLYLALTQLEGLNLQCGRDDIVMGPDAKHLVKRSATLLRSKDGMLVNGVIVHRTHLQEFLQLLPGQSYDTVKILIDPSDHQNVPRAVELLEALASLGDVDSSHMAPTELVVFSTIKLLGEFWYSFLEPLINPTLSLSEQLRCLSRFGHLSFALYHLHGSSFMSNQLYGDTQAFVKAAFVAVERQRHLDEDLPFYLYQMGSDRLEEIFGEVRTQNHDRNCDILQLSDRLSTSVDNVDILNSYPRWNPGQRRISYTGAEGVDHVNPRYFTGNLIVKDVFTGSVWAKGRLDAEKVLKRYSVAFDFSESLSVPGVDFLRPRGGDKFPGVSTDIDRSIFIEEPTQSTATDAGAISTSTPAEPPEDLIDISLEDILTEPDSAGNVATSEDDSRHWLEITLPNGTKKLYHKASLLGGLFKSDRRRLSVERVLRVRCYSKDFRKPTLFGEESPGENSFLVGDTVLCPIHILDAIVIGVASVIAIDRKGVRVSHVDLEELNSSSDIMISTQILVLRDVEVTEILDAPPSSLEDPTSDSASVDEHSVSVMTRKWVWNGDYARFLPLTSSTVTAQVTDNGSRNAYVVRVPGNLVQPIGLDIVPCHVLPPADRMRLEGRNIHSTCSISFDGLADVANSAYETREASDYIGKLKKHGQSTTLPYIDQNGAQQLIVAVATQTLIAKKSETGKVTCYQCGSIINSDAARGHVGLHILRALAGVVETGLRELVDPCTACGFCGRSGCETGLDKAGKSFRATSNCMRYHKFSYQSALNSSSRTPSTNVPMHCLLCGPDPITKRLPVIWKYNMFHHLRTQHPHRWDAARCIPHSLDAQVDTVLVISAEEYAAAMKGQQTSSPHSLATAPYPSFVSLPYLGNGSADLSTAASRTAQAPQSKRKSRTST